MKNVSNDMMKQLNEGEISDDQLEAVAGGGKDFWLAMYATAIGCVASLIQRIFAPCVMDYYDLEHKSKK
ncbi:MAG: hypothetical protein N4A62_10545 [Marinisporobacter sp.]|jgi:hypothetical protein|nr:hypothetical protein [Marinisporobacter sp.]